ncbi:uncharacterized protein CEXT_338341 [Caerostris extrusa]|uniref:C2H2-type domain-containing protein n=1 Tax=Caerostris extrusa TaxID=172846 RepID=A0AAV4XKR2_CAEEX|nr:uncharacterized protein CEXT_338341 [Caerostris extrusa]
MGDTSTMHDIEEYMASFSNTNGNSTNSLINLDSSSDEVEIIQELKINLDNHQCDLCCKGTFLVNKLLQFGGVLNDKLKHACDICNQGFKTKSSLTKHKKLHAQGVINENSDIEIELEIPTKKTSVKVNGLSESVMCKDYDMIYGILLHFSQYSGEPPYNIDLCQVVSNFDEFFEPSITESCNEAVYAW